MLFESKMRYAHVVYNPDNSIHSAHLWNEGDEETEDYYKFYGIPDSVINEINAMHVIQTIEWDNGGKSVDLEKWVIA